VDSKPPRVEGRSSINSGPRWFASPFAPNPVVRADPKPRGIKRTHKIALKVCVQINCSDPHNPSFASPRAFGAASLAQSCRGSRSGPPPTSRKHGSGFAKTWAGFSGLTQLNARNLDHLAPRAKQGGHSIPLAFCGFEALNGAARCP